MLLQVFKTLPVKIDWSTLSVVDLIEVIRMSAGTLSPTRKTKRMQKYTSENINIAKHCFQIREKVTLERLHSLNMKSMAIRKSEERESESARLNAFVAHT